MPSSSPCSWGWIFFSQFLPCSNRLARQEYDLDLPKNCFYLPLPSLADRYNNLSFHYMDSLTNYTFGTPTSPSEYLEWKFSLSLTFALQIHLDEDSGKRFIGHVWSWWGEGLPCNYFGCYWTGDLHLVNRSIVVICCLQTYQMFNSLLLHANKWFLLKNAALLCVHGKNKFPEVEQW